MILLKYGNKGPSVITLQVVLNKAAGAGLSVDGDFGPKTRSAVRAFQRGNTLKRDGTVGKKTWPKLATKAGVKIVDVVDAHDPEALTLEAADIRAAGGNPIILYGMSNGVGQAALEVQLRSRSPGKVAILRFHSHGAPGDMNVSAGTGGDSKADLSGISHDNLALAAPALRSLTRQIAPYGCVEFHGCNVGAGATGARLVKGVADLVRRPTSAGIKTQYGGGGGYATFRFEGPVVSAYPGGASRKAWARAHAKP